MMTRLYSFAARFLLRRIRRVHPSALAAWKKVLMQFDAKRLEWKG